MVCKASEGSASSVILFSDFQYDIDRIAITLSGICNFFPNNR